jgi:NTE family protein
VAGTIRDLPDALVLGAGGTLGEAWLRGVLNGLETGAQLDFRACEYLLGTSAGSIVAATLAAGKRPEAGDRAAREWAQAAGPPPSSDELPARSARFGALSRGAAKAGKAVATPFAPLALATTAPAGRLARAAVLSRAPRLERTLGDLGKYVSALGSRFDGRLRIAAVDRSSGRRVMFGAPDAPRANVAEAVLASCAVPWIFAPVEIGGREYVDGGVWSPTNLDAVPAGRGSRVLCLMPTAGATLAPLRTVSSAAAGYESMALRARGAEVRTIGPDDASLAAIGPNLMDPSRRAAVAAAGYAQGRRLS